MLSTAALAGGGMLSSPCSACWAAAGLAGGGGMALPRCRDALATLAPIRMPPPSLAPGSPGRSNAAEAACCAADNPKPAATSGMREASSAAVPLASDEGAVSFSGSV